VAHEVRHVAAERGDLVGDRVSEQEPDPAEREEEREVYAQDRQPARKAQVRERGHEGIEDQRDDRGDHEDQDHFASGFHDDIRREQRDRQQHQLDPARDTTRGGILGSPRAPVSAGSCAPSSGACTGFSETPVTCRPPWAEYV